MATTSKSRWGMLLAGSALTLTLLSAPVLAETLFTATADGFVGQVRAGGAQPGAPIFKGSKVTVAGQGLLPGQEITLQRGPSVLNKDAPITVDGEGKFSFSFDLDAEAETGLQPVVVIAEKPAAATVIDLKISPEVPLSGAELFDIKSEPVTKGLYQVAYSEASNAVFVTSSVGRPPVRESKLVKLNPETLAIEAEVTPAEAPQRAGGPGAPGGEAPPPGAQPPAGGAGGQPPAPQGPGVFAVYGVGVDDANGNVWVTNTRQNTVAVYKQSDLSLVKQFEPGAAAHARDVVIDTANSRAYVSTVSDTIEVFDTKTLEQLEPITLRSAQRGGEFAAIALDLDAASGKLFTVSMKSNEAAEVDLTTNTPRVFPLPGARSAAGVAYDAKEGLLFVVSQGSDNLLVVKAETGEVVADTEIGAGALYVTFDPVSRHVFAGSRGAGTITVLDTAGKIVANLDAGNLPNQVRVGAKGVIWAVNKSRGENDDAGDRLWRIEPVAK